MTPSNPDAPVFALVAGEASGDNLGAALMEALRARVPGARFVGVAGPRMRAAGWTDVEPATTSPVDGSVMRAIFAHEEAEGRYGGVAGLLAEREVRFRDPAVQQILDQSRQKRE